MPLLVNLRHLEADAVELQGELPVPELDIDMHDEVEKVDHPLAYELEVQKVEEGLLVQGSLRLLLECQCVRCLKHFSQEVALMHWTRHLALEGDEAVPVVNDCVDLTPFLREDMLLEFPQHPLCDPDCGGLPDMKVGQADNSRSISQPEKGSPAWDELNKLNL